MSLSTVFANHARGQGLDLRGIFGNFAADHPDYHSVRMRSAHRYAQASALRSGQAVHGRKLDGVPLDARAPVARDTSHALDWAEWAERKFGAGAGMALLKKCDEAGKAGRADGSRADAIVPMASQGLTYFMPEVYQIRHNDLPCWEGKILDIDKRIAPAANEFVWYESDNVGLAKASNSYDVTTIPMVNGPVASDNKGLIVPALVGYETNFMDPRRASLAEAMGKPDFQIEVMKRQACERTLAEFFNSLWFGGDGSHGIDGLFNNPIVETLPIAGGTWASKTALQILADLILMVWAIPNRTAGSLGDLGKIKIVLPPDQYQRLMIPITSAGSASILDYFIAYFKQSGHGVPDVSFEFSFAASNSYAYNGGPAVLAEDTALIVYKEGNMDRDPTFVLSQPIEVPAPVRTTGVGDVTYYHARGGGLKLPDAQRMLYVVGL